MSKEGLQVQLTGPLHTYSVDFLFNSMLNEACLWRLGLQKKVRFRFHPPSRRAAVCLQQGPKFSHPYWETTTSYDTLNYIKLGRAGPACVVSL